MLDYLASDLVKYTSMQYTVIETGGKQYKVAVGDVIEVETLKIDSGDVSFDSVLLHVDGEKAEIGTPFISGFSVSGKVIGTKKGEKIRVSQFKAKARQRRTIGHRKLLSRVEITVLGKKTASTKKTA